LRLNPHIYHLAQANNWTSIQKHGLMSTIAMLELAKLEQSHGKTIATRLRPECITLPTGQEIRDQRPMNEKALRDCLRNIDLEDWIVLLNSKVFFWCNKRGLQAMRAAYLQQEQIALTIDTENLLLRHSESVQLTPINTGNTRRAPAPRGRETFVPYFTWLQTGWQTESVLRTKPRKLDPEPVELVVHRAVPEILQCIVAIRILHPGDQFNE
jgi:hypothetical protein